MTARLPDGYFDRIYAESADPWQLSTRWYEQRKYAITMALLPFRRYRHAFEPGCSIGTLTEQLAGRCDHVTAVDVADAALDAILAGLSTPDAANVCAGACRSMILGGRRHVIWWCCPRSATTWRPPHSHGHGPRGAAAGLRRDRADGARRHAVADYPMTGDHANDVIVATAGLTMSGDIATPTS